MNPSRPTFEVICLGTGGGPLETEVSGYMLKSYQSKWEDGWISVEGGAGLGCLTNIIAQEEQTNRLRDLEAQLARQMNQGLGAIQENGSAGLFDDVIWPNGVTTPVLKAGYLFKYLSSYVVSHAHLDHTCAMIIQTGSLVGPGDNQHHTDDSSSLATTDANTHMLGRRLPVYASMHTLKGLEKVYNSETWPELGCWSPEGLAHEESPGSGHHNGQLAERRRSLDKPVMRKSSSSKFPENLHLGNIFRSRRDSIVDANGNGSGDSTGKVDVMNGDTRKAHHLVPGVGIQFCPTPPASIYQKLPGSTRISIMEMPIIHGYNEAGACHSSAFFFRTRDDDMGCGNELLFWGDVSSKQDDRTTTLPQEDYNSKVWKEAANRWDQGKLKGVFIECSYDSSRPEHLLFGHMNTTALHAELETMASFATNSLQGLPVFITHIKEKLLPDPNGMSARQKIARDLQEPEKTVRLGVRFICVEKGMRLIF